MKQSIQPYLLPGILRIPGCVIAAFGIVLLIIRFYYGIKPEWMETYVFAIYSAYLDVKYMAVIQNQVLEELGALLLFAGLYMIAFSKEKRETPIINILRLKAFMISIWANAVLIVISILFIYGFGYAVIMMLDIIFLLVAYIISFRVMVFRNHKVRLAK